MVADLLRRELEPRVGECRHPLRVDPLARQPLREHLLAPRLVGLLVVRLGGYGAGVYADEKID